MNFGSKFSKNLAVGGVTTRNSEAPELGHLLPWGHSLLMQFLITDRELSLNSKAQCKPICITHPFTLVLLHAPKVCQEAGLCIKNHVSAM